MTTLPPAPARLIIVDDHALFRAGLRLLCDREPDLTVVGEASGAQDALVLAQQEQPDIVLLDVDLSGVDGLDLIEGLHAAAPGSRIVVITGLRDGGLQARALHRGARGFLSKETSALMTLKAIRKVRAGELWFDHGTVAATVDRLRRDQKNTPGARAAFTARELAIIRGVAEGLTNAVIARQVAIGEKTVRNQLTVIFEKANVHDRLQLALYAYRHGLARPPF